MKNSKKMKVTVAIASLAILAVAFVGVAYAINYTGSTVNTANTVTSVDITVGQGSYSGSFTKTVYYNTSTAAGPTTTYTLNPDQAGFVEDFDEDVDAVLLGTAVLTITEKNNGGYDNYILTISHDNAITGDYFIKYKINSGAFSAATQLPSAASGSVSTTTITGAASNTVTVELYLAIDAAGTTTEPGATPVNNASFTFVATATHA